MILDFNSAPLQADPAQAPEWVQTYDTKEVYAALCRSMEGVLGYLYPNGFSDPKAKKFYIGNINGDGGESLSVELQGPKAGLWHDFATQEGGDIFDLWRAARGLSSFRETLKDAAEYSGATANTPRRTPKRKNPKGGEAWGVPTKTYSYFDTSGKLIAEVERFDWEDDGVRKKTFRPWDVASRSYRAPETRPLYNLPNIASAPEIIVVEGEKSADALIGQNIDATTAMGGAAAPLEKTDWSPLKGRKVVIWPDNDAPGRAYAERLKAHLEREGALAVSILNVPTSRPEKWDAADADQDGEDLGAVIKSMRSDAGQLIARQSQYFTASDLEGIIVPPRKWLVDGLIPANQVTMLGGDGGVGKSLLALQLAVAASIGGQWIGHMPETGRVIHISAEDDKDELHRRLADVAKGMGLTLGSLTNLIIRSLAGEDALLAVADQRSGTLQPTALFHELDAFVKESGAKLLILDTLADLHSGQENDRTVARQFIGLLRGMALRHECTILLLAHPSLTGMSSGSGLSGSTAWNNSVRSRLYFERIIEDGFEADPDLRRMSTKKANYGRTGEERTVRWINGMFVVENSGGGFDSMASTPKARRVFLALLEKAEMEGRNVNANGGPNYAPSVFGKDPRNERVSKAAFQAAMTDLFAIDAIRAESFGPPSRPSTRIVRTPE